MADYRGFGKARTPLLPMLGVPTTAGTGSEAQSYALVSDAETHEKMACGDDDGDVSHRAPRPRPHAHPAAGSDRRRRVRRDLTCGRDVRDPEAESGLGCFFARGVPAALFELRAGHGKTARRRCALVHAARGLLRRGRHRELDARSDSCLRESADRPLRHGPRPRHLDVPPFRRALQLRTSPPNAIESSWVSRGWRFAETTRARRLPFTWSGSRARAVFRRASATTESPRTIFPRSPSKPRSSGRERSTRGRSTKARRSRSIGARTDGLRSSDSRSSVSNRMRSPRAMSGASFEETRSGPAARPRKSPTTSGSSGASKRDFPSTRPPPSSTAWST